LDPLKQQKGQQKLILGEIDPLGHRFFGKELVKTEKRDKIIKYNEEIH